MKTTKRFTIIAALLIASCVTRAQLASERPVEDVLSPAMKAKLGTMPRNNRVAVQPGQLASARGLPVFSPAVMAKLKTPPAGLRTASSTTVKAEQLASNKPVSEVDKLVKEKQLQQKQASARKPEANKK
jgi:hypothetical protein